MRTPSYHNYLTLMRLDRPIGWLLLLWPTWLALWGADPAVAPSIKLIIVFTGGVIIMRSAGCVINDWADRHIDGQVERTRQRPLVTGNCSKKGVIRLLLGLVGVAFLLVCTTNLLTIALSGIALVLASIYPFMKRYTYFPQLILGIAFAWGIPMAYTARLGYFSSQAVWLLIATVLWTMAFDTIYAMVDKKDDLKIGVKSTAIAFGERDTLAVGMLQAGALLFFAMWGKLAGLGIGYTAGWVVAVLISLYQQRLIHQRVPSMCFQAFLNSHWVGAALFLGAWCDLTIFPSPV